MTTNKAVWIFPFILVSLLAAIWSGWVRIGWSLPLSGVAAQHGALMVNCFLASLIYLERAVTFKSRWLLLLPFVSAASSLAFALQMLSLAFSMQLAGSACFVVMCSYFLYRYKEFYYAIFLTGAICLVVGNILLVKTGAYPQSVTWWIGFLLFTIVAERIELSRFLALTPVKHILLLLCLSSTFLVLCLPFLVAGPFVLALSVGATAIWLLAFDMARHSIKIGGQHRYSGWLLIVGYCWLLVMAVLLIVRPRIAFGYDAVLHSFFIGFVFSMIFSHAPIILPAVVKVPVKLYRPVFYLWFALLQLSLLMRIAGDCLGVATLRRTGGLLNGVMIILFFLSIAYIVRSELRRKALHKA